jgi:hypothetical protein
MAGSGVHDDETSGSVEGGTFFCKLSDCWLFKKDSSFIGFGISGFYRLVLEIFSLRCFEMLELPDLYFGLYIETQNDCFVACINEPATLNMYQYSEL